MTKESFFETSGLTVDEHNIMKHITWQYFSITSNFTLQYLKTRTNPRNACLLKNFVISE